MDGQPGARTRLAIAEWQRRQGLAATGVLTVGHYARLFEPDTAPAADAPEFAEAPPANRAPVAAPDRWRMTETADTRDLLANDSDPDGDALALTEVLVRPGSLPDGVTLKNEKSGRLRVTAPPGTEAELPFTYTVVDTKGGSARGTGRIEIAVPGRPPAPAFVATPRSDVVALVIGNRHYTAGPGEVRYAERDARAIERYFEEVMGVEPRLVIREENLGFAGMRRWFGSPANPRGRLHDFAELPGVEEVWVFYSGHGAPDLGADGGPRGYLVPADGDAAAPQDTGYSLELLAKNLSALPAETVVLMLDACFSGLTPAPGGLVPGVSANISAAVLPPPQRANLAIISATDFGRTQYANWLEEKRHGAFTWHALKALHGAADGDGDGEVRLSELGDYLLREVSLSALDAGKGAQRPAILPGGP
ncbi:MAG: Ig-like domain-containing protein, partial [Pseudomonadota bacterium]